MRAVRHCSLRAMRSSRLGGALLNDGKLRRRAVTTAAASISCLQTRTWQRHRGPIGGSAQRGFGH